MDYKELIGKYINNGSLNLLVTDIYLVWQDGLDLYVIVNTSQGFYQYLYDSTINRYQLTFPKLRLEGNKGMYVLHSDGSLYFIDRYIFELSISEIIKNQSHPVDYEYE